MEDKMIAAVFEGKGKLKLKEIPTPKITKSDEVIIRVEAVSICGTDVHIVSVPPSFEAKPNTVLGHELTGKIVEVGSAVKNLKKGDRIVVNPNDYDGTCMYCKMNLPNQCVNLQALGITKDGGFAKYCKVTEKVCHKISESVLPELAAFAEPLSCVINGTQKVKIQPGDTAVILGGGPIGLLFLKMFKASGASKVILSEPSDFRREVALNNGADLVVNSTDEDVEKVIREETVIGADVVVDAVGCLMDECVGIVRKGGKILVFGVNTKAIANIPQSEVTFKELQILGTWLANATFPKAVKIIESGILNLKGLITHKIKLDNIHQGIDLLKNGKAVKVIIEM